MKKLLLTISLIMLSFNAYSFEQVIGFGGGLNFDKSKLRHTQEVDFKNPNKSTSDQNSERKQQTYWDKTSTKNSGYNFDLEYQARFDVTNAPNFWVIGFGYSNSNTSINFKYQDLGDVKYKINSPYVLAMMTLFQSKNFAFRYGFTFNQDFIKIDSTKYNKLNANMLIDGEYSVSNNFMLFSRVYYQLNYGKRTSLDTNLVIDQAMQHEDVNIISNKIDRDYEKGLFKLNFGVRYKI